MARQSFSRLITRRARTRPDEVVVIDDVDGRTLTAAELDRESNRLAREYRDRGVGHDDLVTVSLPNSVDFVLACAGIWKAGATPQPLDPATPSAERCEIERLTQPALVLGQPPCDTRIAWLPTGLAASSDTCDAELPDMWASSWKAPASSGSTGRAKIVKATAAAMFDPDLPVAEFFPRDAVQLVTGPLWHSASFTYAFRGLLTGHTLVLAGDPDEHRLLTVIDRHHITWAVVSAAMVHRLVRLPRSARGDLRSLRSVVHLGAPCSIADKRALVDWLGADRVVEVYAGSESNGLTMITGAESMRKPGSVGKPLGGTEIRILHDDGSPVRPGDIGHVWMRRKGAPAYSYLGASSRRTADGWDTLGDMGTVDADGYLTIVDRSADVIDVGGTIVYPSRVERVLEGHSAVREAVVFGAPDGRGGQVVAAVVDVGEATVDPECLYAFVEESLSTTERPARIEMRTGGLRNSAGKVRRSALHPCTTPR